MIEKQSKKTGGYSLLVYPLWKQYLLTNENIFSMGMGKAQVKYKGGYIEVHCTNRDQCIRAHNLLEKPEKFEMKYAQGGAHPASCR